MVVATAYPKNDIRYCGIKNRCQRPTRRRRAWSTFCLAPMEAEITSWIYCTSNLAPERTYKCQIHAFAYIFSYPFFFQTVKSYSLPTRHLFNMLNLERFCIGRGDKSARWEGSVVSREWSPEPHYRETKRNSQLICTWCKCRWHSADCTRAA